MKYFVEFWKRAFDFKGVASRPQYWYAVLINFFVILVLSLLFGASDSTENITVSDVYALIILIPSISISVRRLHDQNRSGWFYLLNLIPAIGSIIIFIFMVLGTVKVNNRWRMYDIQRGYIKDDLFDTPLANDNSNTGQWTYKG